MLGYYVMVYHKYKTGSANVQDMKREWLDWGLGGRGLEGWLEACLLIVFR